VSDSNDLLGRTYASLFRWDAAPVDGTRQLRAIGCVDRCSCGGDGLVRTALERTAFHPLLGAAIAAAR
jgi:hypothetical protein